MNKTILASIIFLLGLINTSFSQDDINQIINYIKDSNYDAAQSQIKKLESTGKYNENPKFWFYKGLFYHSIMEEENQELNKKYPEAIEKSYESYKTALKYDTEKEYNEQIFKALGFLTNEFVHEGSLKFNNGDYEKALKYFENSIEINTMPQIMFYDTIIYYNAALSAEKLKQYDKAIGFYKTLISYKYGEGRMYKDLSEVYKILGKQDLYLQTLLDGIKLYPDDNELLIELINHYLLVSDVDNAFKYVNMSLEIDTTNPGIYFVLGSLYESKNDFKNAEKAYLKCLEIDEKYTDAAHNLGAMYYNNANDIFSHAKTKNEKEKYIEGFKKSLKYFKIVEQNEQEDKNVLLTMRNIYRILEMDKEKAEIDKRLEEMR